MNPLVSAVIPTHRRPELLLRAVRSALGQTYTNLEVIVVVDGPEPETVKMLEALQEPRLRVIALQENVGGSGARNSGVDAAHGEWVALLDDDDEWLPEKIDKQVASLMHAAPATNFVVCRSIVRTEIEERIMPSRFPLQGEHWAEFMYCSGERLLFSSSGLIARSLLLAVPFTKGILSSEDNDWLFRALAANQIFPEWVEEVLAIIHGDYDRAHLSQRSDWRPSYEWAVRNRQTLLTPKSFAYFLLREVVASTQRSGKPTYRLIFDRMFLFYSAVRMGKIDLRFSVYFVLFSIIGDAKRHRLRVLYELAARKISTKAAVTELTAQ